MFPPQLPFAVRGILERFLHRTDADEFVSLEAHRMAKRPAHFQERHRLIIYDKLVKVEVDFRRQSSLHQSPIGIKVIGETLYP